MTAAGAAAVAHVREASLPGPLPVFRHEAWRDLSWLVHGITSRGEGDVDFGLFATGAAGVVMRRYRELAASYGFRSIALAPQEHGRTIIHHAVAAPGVLVTAPADGHDTRTDGPLLAVTIADCVPVYIVDVSTRRIALLHAGWRGVAAGILEAGVQSLGARPDDLRIHFGPAICGECYEVGPEVHAALGLARPARNRPVDLRALLAQRALVLGVPASHITISAWCTRCAVSPFHSHRAGHAGRQAAFLGIRAA